MNRFVKWIKGLFHKETAEEEAERLFTERKLEPVEKETEEEEMRGLYERHWKPPEGKPRVLERPFHRPMSGLRYPKALREFTGLGMEELQRKGRRARHHEKSMGVDHELGVEDVDDREPRKRKKRRWKG